MKISALNKSLPKMYGLLAGAYVFACVNYPRDYKNVSHSLAGLS